MAIASPRNPASPDGSPRRPPPLPDPLTLSIFLLFPLNTTLLPILVEPSSVSVEELSSAPAVGSVSPLAPPTDAAPPPLHAPLPLCVSILSPHLAPPLSLTLTSLSLSRPVTPR
ncbi:unnamed protein product [Brassica oleracea]